MTTSLTEGKLNEKRTIYPSELNDFSLKFLKGYPDYDRHLKTTREHNGQNIVITTKIRTLV